MLRATKEQAKHYDEWRRQQDTFEITMVRWNPMHTTIAAMYAEYCREEEREATDYAADRGAECYAMLVQVLAFEGGNLSEDLEDRIRLLLEAIENKEGVMYPGNDGV